MIVLLARLLGVPLAGGVVLVGALRKCEAVTREWRWRRLERRLGFRREFLPGGRGTR
jgi:hypothetical protein